MAAGPLGKQGENMPEAAQPAPEDSQRNFSVPQGWTVNHSERASILTGPEGDIEIAFVELEPAANIQETALAAWRAIDPQFASKVIREAALPPQGAWEEMHQVVYEVPPNLGRVESAVLRRFRSRAFVNLVRGTTAGMSRRGAQLFEAMNSWKPAGYQEISLKDRAASPWTEEHSAKLKQFVLSAMETMQVPGVSVAIVQGGRMVWAEGFGKREIREPSPVTPQTRFMIGSTTKALTSLLMARLIDQGKAAWSTPVCDLLPDFALADAEITGRLTLAHTVSASTGMPRQDSEIIFQHSGITPEQRLAQMKTMRPTTGFGETFQYSNLLVAAGGYAAARAFCPAGPLEEAFGRALEELVFRPLGMKDSCLRQEDALQAEAALPHAINFDGGVSRLPLSMERFAYSVAPAGAAWSTAPDLARYLMLELGKGRMPEGERIVSEEALLERRKKGVKIDDHASYGLGLMVSDQSGLRVIHHGGNTLGFSADLFFVPERDLGVVALTNLYAAVGFLGAFRQKIFELAFGGEPKAGKTIAMSEKLDREGVALLKQKVAVDPASMEWVSELTGRYRSAELGSATLTKRDDGFWMQFEDWGSTVGSEIRSGDRLLRLLSPPWRGVLKVLVDVDAKALLLDQGQSKYLFRREAD